MDLYIKGGGGANRENFVGTTSVNPTLIRSTTTTTKNREKTLNNQSKKRYTILEVKIHHPKWGSNPSTSNIGDKFAWSKRTDSAHIQTQTDRHTHTRKNTQAC